MSDEIIEHNNIKHAVTNENAMHNISQTINGHQTEEAHGNHQEHEHTLYAEPVFYIGDLPITNSLVTSWVAVFLIIILATVIRLKLKKIPQVFQSIMEIIVDGALDMMDLVTNNRKKSEQVFPVIFSIFVFVLINNWLGLLPGIGSITFDGVALFRGGTADLNTTLALGIFSVIAANIFGMIVTGVWAHFNKFINLKALAQIPGKIVKDPTIILVNPITFFVGLIEIIGEIAKIASLSFRLFGNVFAGEVLIGSIAVMAAYLVPLPFMFLELIVGVIQALIFAVLTLVYFTIASMEHEH